MNLYVIRDDSNLSPCWRHTPVIGGGPTHFCWKSEIFFLFRNRVLRACCCCCCCLFFTERPLFAVKNLFLSYLCCCRLDRLHWTWIWLHIATLLASKYVGRLWSCVHWSPTTRLLPHVPNLLDNHCSFPLSDHVYYCALQLHVALWCWCTTTFPLPAKSELPLRVCGIHVELTFSLSSSIFFYTFMKRFCTSACTSISHETPRSVRLFAFGAPWKAQAEVDFKWDSTLRLVTALWVLCGRP